MKRETKLSYRGRFGERGGEQLIHSCGGMGGLCEYFRVAAVLRFVKIFLKYCFQELKPDGLFAL